MIKWMQTHVPSRFLTRYSMVWWGCESHKSGIQWVSSFSWLDSLLIGKATTSNFSSNSYPLKQWLQSVITTWPRHSTWVSGVGIQFNPRYTFFNLTQRQQKEFPSSRSSHVITIACQWYKFKKIYMEETLPNYLQKIPHEHFILLKIINMKIKWQKEIKRTLQHYRNQLSTPNHYYRSSKKKKITHSKK